MSPHVPKESSSSSSKEKEVDGWSWTFGGLGPDWTSATKPACGSARGLNRGGKEAEAEDGMSRSGGSPFEGHEGGGADDAAGGAGSTGVGL